MRQIKRTLISGVGLATLLRLTEPGAAADLPVAMPVKAPAITAEYDWTGFYLGAHLGYAGGSSNWTASSTTAVIPGLSGSLSLLQRFDPFNEAGGFFGGLQVGYDYMFPNRFVIGAEVDASAPAWPNLAGISIGGTSTFSTPLIGAESYSETMLYFGSLRARVGYAPGNWFRLSDRRLRVDL
jgi:high affinity Mn2+ porin